MTLQHVSLEVRRDDVPGELRFWALLGFTEVEPPGTLAEVASWVQRDGTQIHLLFADDPVVPPQGHAAVVVDDFDATARRAARGGPRRRRSARATGAPPARSSTARRVTPSS